jgi:uncharacterized membrane protein HdeD (DUF308 family)
VSYLITVLKVLWGFMLVFSPIWGAICLGWIVGVDADE